MPRTPVPPDNARSDTINKLLLPTTDASAHNVTHVIAAARRHQHSACDPVDLGDARLRRDISRLIQAHGSRPIAELLIELGQVLMVRTEIDRRLRRYVLALVGPDERH